jgi:hypothetical protein
LGRFFGDFAAKVGFSLHVSLVMRDEREQKHDTS